MDTASGERPGRNLVDDSREHTAAGRYAALGADKLIFLQRARVCAKVTIPMLFPPQGHSSATTYYTPFQSVGADCVNNLGSKIMLVLFPPGEPFFKLVGSAKLRKHIRNQKSDEDGISMKTNFDKAMRHVEDDITEELEAKGARIAETMTTLQLLVSGNALVQVKDNNKLLCHHLENYVVRRDVEGNVIEIILRQTLRRQSLPDEVKDFLMEQEGNRKDLIEPTSDTSSMDRSISMDEGNIDLFTWAQVAGSGKRGKNKKRWEFHQEISGKEIPGTDGTWPIDAPGLIPQVWTLIQGEHYGRGYVEHYLGDLNSLEALSQTMVEAASIAGQVKFIVDETGLTNIDEIGNSANGSFNHGEVEGGKPKNVAVVQVDKPIDFKFLMETIQLIAERLYKAFLRVQPRDAERVTAEEIREVAKELEASLGGAYAMLSQEFQRPIVKRVMLNMQKRGEVDNWPKELIRAEITAGLEGLGREQAAARLVKVVNSIGQVFGPQAMSAAMNLGEFIARLGLESNVDMDGLTKTAQQQQQEAQGAQTAALQQKLGPGMVKAASDQANSMREHPDSPVDQHPGGAIGAVQSQMQGKVAPHAAAAKAAPPQPPR